MLDGVPPARVPLTPCRPARRVRARDRAVSARSAPRPRRHGRRRQSRTPAGVDAGLRRLDRRRARAAGSTSRPWRPTRPATPPGLAGAAARSGADVVVTLGGDGTVNEAANGLLGTGVPLFPLPGGSQNVYAKLLGIPADLVDAAEHLLRLADRWHPRTVDAGRVNGRLFTFSAGVGLDAAVVARVDANPERKARWRELAYIQSAVGVFLRDYAIRAPKLVVEAPGTRTGRGRHGPRPERAELHVRGEAPDRGLPATSRSTPGRSPPASCGAPRRWISPRWARASGSAGLARGGPPPRRLARGPGHAHRPPRRRHARRGAGRRGRAAAADAAVFDVVPGALTVVA